MKLTDFKRKVRRWEAIADLIEAVDRLLAKSDPDHESDVVGDLRSARGQLEGVP